MEVYRWLVIFSSDGCFIERIIQPNWSSRITPVRE